MLGGNAIELFGFDDQKMLEYASEWGPTVAEVAVPIAGRPEVSDLAFRVRVPAGRELGEGPVGPRRP